VIQGIKSLKGVCGRRSRRSAKKHDKIKDGPGKDLELEAIK